MDHHALSLITSLNSNPTLSTKDYAMRTPVGQVGHPGEAVLQHEPLIVQVPVAPVQMAVIPCPAMADHAQEVHCYVLLAAQIPRKLGRSGLVVEHVEVRHHHPHPLPR